MDNRIKRHAEILVDYCTSVGCNDNVLIKAPTPAEDLVVALYEKLGERGARPTTSWLNRRAGRAYARAMDVDDFRTKDHQLAAMEETDVVILIKGSNNMAEGSDVDPEKGTAANHAKQPILQERLDTRWVITQHPTSADAQKAEMSTAAWADYIYDAVNIDWVAQREFQQQMVDVLNPAEEVRIVSDDSTDLRFSVSGMTTINDAGKKNMPAGEVATCPVPNSVNGKVTFDMPLIRNSREIHDIQLIFEDGAVVDYSASKNEEVLTNLLETDQGARRVGELGIGMNRGIDQFTNNILFDEKMGDTVHIALGNAMEECVPDDLEFNESAIHADMLIDMSQNSRIEVDGTVVQRNGVFQFENGFEKESN